MKPKIFFMLFVLVFFSLILINSDNPSYADIKSGKSIMASEIEVIPDSLILNIPPSSKNNTKAKRRQLSGPLTVNLDTLWDNENYWEDIIPGRVIIRYAKDIDVHTAKFADLGFTDKSIKIVHKGLKPLNFIIVDVPGSLSDIKSFMKLMKAKPYIENIEPDRPMHILFTPNDTYYGQYQWDKRLINCPAAWDLGLGSMDISIAIIDQGADYTHQDLQARYTSTKGYDFLSGDSDPMPATTSEAHGTHCSGVAAATINNGAGIAGISNSHLYSLRVGDGTVLNTGACIDAIIWCGNNGINVVSMSWGNYTYVAETDNACRHADSAGCILVSGTGNDATTPMMYPAKLPEVIAVGAIDSLNQIWQENSSIGSNYGAETELAAPGKDVIGTIPGGAGNEYQMWSGTSEACPQVSGAAALVWSANPNLTSDEVRGVLDSSAIDLGNTGRDQYYGYGKLNVYGAIQKALEMSGPRDTGTISVNNKSSASSNLIVSGITKSQNWILSISPLSFGVPPGGAKQVTVIVGGSFSEGYLRDTLWIASNDPTYPVYPVPIILQVAGIEEKRIAIDNMGLKTFLKPTSKQISISYTIPLTSLTTLNIYDASGRLVKSVENGEKESGTYSMNINTTDLSSGIYFVILNSCNRQLSGKIVLIK